MDLNHRLSLQRRSGATARCLSLLGQPPELLAVRVGLEPTWPAIRQSGGLAIRCDPITRPHRNAMCDCSATPLTHFKELDWQFRDTFQEFLVRFGTRGGTRTRISPAPEAGA